MIAENRMLQDRIAEVEILEEEIALYKARSETLNRRLNDLKQKLMEYQEMEQELCDYKRAFERKDAELRDSEDSNLQLTCIIESQNREMDRNKAVLHDLCRIQKELTTLYGHSGLEYIDETGICTSSSVPLGVKRSITGPEQSAQIVVKHEDEALKNCNQQLEALRGEFQKLRAETSGGN